MKSFVRESSLRYPAVVLEEDGAMKTIMTSADLNACGGDPDALWIELIQREVVTAGKKSISSSL